MSENGLMLLDYVAGDSFAVYLVAMSLDLFSADVLSLVGGKAVSVAQKLETMAEALLGSLGGKDGMISAKSAIDAFPEAIEADVPMLPYNLLLPTTNDDYVLTPFDARLSSVEFKPFYDILTPSSEISASLALAKIYKAVYRKKGVSVAKPALPLLNLRERYGGGVFNLPCYGGSSEELFVQAAYNNEDWETSEADCAYYGIWSKDVPSSQTWHFKWTERDFAVSAELDLEKGFVVKLTGSGSNMPGGFNADYPVEVTKGFERTFGTGSSLLFYRSGSGDNLPAFSFPTGVASFVPIPRPAAQIGGVLSGILGIATKTGVLDSVWRRGKNA